MLADITFTLTTEVVYAAAWFAIGSATTLVGITALELRTRKRAESAKDEIRDEIRRYR
jgi:bacteriorhodopsin